MNHKIVGLVSFSIVVFFVVVSALFAASIQARVPAGVERHTAARIPHGTDGDAADCGRCHHISDGSLPLTHRYFATASCTTCHVEAGVTTIPHSTAMGDDRCALCHGDPGRDLGMPESHLDYQDDACSFCHRPDTLKADTQPAPAGASARFKPPMTHGSTGAFDTCTYCHRIDSEPSMPESHWAFTEETCDQCHTPESE